MEYQLPKEVAKIIKQFTDANYQIYIIGGAVRDLLMGRPITDWDFTTDAKPEEILALFPDGFYDNKFGTVGIPVAQGLRHKDYGKRTTVKGNRAVARSNLTVIGSPLALSQIYEITTMRKEGEYKDFRHPIEVGWTNKIEEDLARRDFTINALALSPEGEIIDPFAGQQDLQKKLLKAVGNPEKRFKEDALRLMRAVRIATELRFDIDKETFLAVEKNAQLVKQVAWERIRDELFKILSSDNPYPGIVLLRKTGILQIILPELEKCFGVLQEGPKHARVYDIGEHSLLTLKETPSSDPLVRFAALLHDIGKPETMQITSDSNVTFYNHEVVGGKLTLQIAKKFNLSKKQTDKLYRLVRWHLFTVDENQTDSAIRRFIKNVCIENIDDMLALRIGDRLGGGTQRAVSWRMENFKKRIAQVLTKPFSITDLKVNGQDVMEILNIPPSRKVGEILNKLFQEVLKDSAKNNREYLLKRIQDLC